MEDTDADLLQGQVLALREALLLMLQANPALHAATHRQLMQLHASGLATSLREAALQGFGEIADALAPHPSA